MTFQWLWIILLYVACAESSTPKGCENLTRTQHDADWGFSRIMPVADFGFLIRYYELLCCGENYDSLTWTFKGDQDTTEKPYPWFGRFEALGYELDSQYKNQRLVIKSIKYEDQGTYTCTMKKGDQASKSHSLRLTVAPSAAYNGPAQMTIRPRDRATPTGSNVTFGCEGFYGTTKNPLMSGKKIEWTVKVSDDKPYRWARVKHGFPRYHERKTYRDNRLYIGSYLTITDVQEEDYDAVFQCIVTNNIGTAQNQTVQILRPDPPVIEEGPYKNVLVGLACVLGSVILLSVILLTILVWNYRLELRILRDKFSKSELLGWKKDAPRVRAPKS